MSLTEELKNWLKILYQKGVWLSTLLQRFCLISVLSLKVVAEKRAVICVCEWKQKVADSAPVFALPLNLILLDGT